MSYLGAHLACYADLDVLFWGIYLARDAAREFKALCSTYVSRDMAYVG